MVSISSIHPFSLIPSFPPFTLYLPPRYNLYHVSSVLSSSSLSVFTNHPGVWRRRLYIHLSIYPPSVQPLIPHVHPSISLLPLSIILRLPCFSTSSLATVVTPTLSLPPPCSPVGQCGGIKSKVLHPSDELIGPWGGGKWNRIKKRTGCQWVVGCWGWALSQRDTAHRGEYLQNPNWEWWLAGAAYLSVRLRVRLSRIIFSY